MAQGLLGLKSLEDFNVKGKNVFLRLDLNVPLKNGEITDDTRIQAALPTIKWLLEHEAKIVMASHLGRPKTPEDRQKLSLEPVAKYLGELLDIDVMLVEEPGADTPKALLHNLTKGQVVMLENLRFDPAETANAHSLIEAWKEYTDIYINDAFGASHRAHASVVGLPDEMTQKGLGFLMKKEIEMLDRMLHDMDKPFVAILGGAKVSDKIGVIQKLMDQVDAFVIGGAMAYTFLSAQGVEVGNSLVEKDKLNFTKDLLKRIELRDKKIYLPLDHLLVKSLDDKSSAKVSESQAIAPGLMGVDIGPKTIEAFKNIINEAKSVFWNGPMGVFETSEYSKGTFAVAEAVAKSESFSVVGGGDSASAAKKSGFADDFTHISTGGGASLEYLQGADLPGLVALKDKQKRSEAQPVLGELD